MSVLDIIIAPDPVLKQIAAPIGNVDATIKKLAHDMLETMYAAKGVGLAAPQVNISQRMIVIDDAERGTPPQPIILINPVIVKSGAELTILEEGCLSLPDYYVEIERPDDVVVDYIDIHGSRQTLEADGFRAKVLQHEIDHLNGILLVDYLSKLKRDIILKKFDKAKKQGEIL